MTNKESAIDYNADGLTVRYQPVHPITAPKVFVSVLPILIFALVMLYAATHIVSILITALIYSAFVLPDLAPVATAWRHTLYLNPRQLNIKSSFGGYTRTKVLRWSEVVDIHYKDHPSHRILVITTHGQELTFAVRQDYLAERTLQAALQQLTSSAATSNQHHDQQSLDQLRKLSRLTSAAQPTPPTKNQGD